MTECPYCGKDRSNVPMHVMKSVDPVHGPRNQYPDDWEDKKLQVRREKEAARVRRDLQ